MTDVLATTGFAEGDFRVGRVFNRTFSVLSRNFLPFCLVTAVAGMLRLLIALPSASTLRGGGVSAGWFLVELLLGVVIYKISEAVVLYGAFEDMRGRPVHLVESLRVGLRRIFAVLGVAVLVPILAGLATFLLIVPGFILLSMLFVAMPACVVEKLGPLKSMGRSAELTKGHRWKVFGLYILTLLAGTILGALLTGLSRFVAGPIVSLVVTLAWSAVFIAFYAIVVVVTYHDLRVAKEGVNTDQIAAVFD